jgi:hypothetical protein
MNQKKTLRNIFIILYKTIRYNLKIIFANKFVYFLAAAAAFYLLVVMISLFDRNANPNAAVVYYWLLVPGLLLIFYPSVFGLQNDSDVRMLEVLFGIPNYRYKVWLVRLILMYMIVFVLLWILAVLSSLSLIHFNVGLMVFQLMFPVFFLGSLGFLASTAVRNGYGAAVLIIILGLIFWILSGVLAENKWNLFLNPFAAPQQVSDLVWRDILVKNRLYQTIGIILCLLTGLLNLQKREKYI